MSGIHQDQQPVPQADSYIVLRQLLRHKVFILVTTLLCTIASGFIAFRFPNIYTATVSAVPPRKTSSSLDAAMSSVSSTLREFGLTKIGGKKGDSYDFVVLLQSRQIQDSLIKNFHLAQVYDIPDTATFKIREELSDRLVFNLEVEGNYTVSVDDESPTRAAEMANYIIRAVNDLSSRIDKSETEVLYKQFEAKITATDKQIQDVRDSLARYGKSHKLFSPADQAKAAASALGELKAQTMKAQIALSIMEQSYGEHDPMTNQQRTIVSELLQKETQAEGSPGFLGNASLADAAGTALPYIRFTAELEALIKLKAFLLPSFEQVKLDLSKVAPSLYVVDEAQAPQKKSRPKRSIIVLSSAVGSFFLACLVILASLQLGYVRKQLRMTSANESSDESTRV